MGSKLLEPIQVGNMTLKKSYYVPAIDDWI